MKIEVNISKRYFIIILGAILLSVGIMVVIAYGSGGPPSVFGHSLEELEGVQQDIDHIACPAGQGITAIAADGTKTCTYNLASSRIITGTECTLICCAANEKVVNVNVNWAQLDIEFGNDVIGSVSVSAAGQCINARTGTFCDGGGVQVLCLS